jgi:hypothetical protein
MLSIETYFYNQGAASAPYSSSLRVPVAPGPSANTMQYIPANALGGLTLISTQVASSSADLRWTSIGSYHYHELRCSTLIPSVSATLYIQFSEDAGNSWKTSGYHWAGFNMYDVGTSVGQEGSASDIGIKLGYNDSATPGLSSVTDLDDLTSSIIKGVTTKMRTKALGNYYVEDFSGFYTGDGGVVTGIRVLASSGNITSGQCSLYGLNS